MYCSYYHARARSYGFTAAFLPVVLILTMLMSGNAEAAGLVNRKKAAEYDVEMRIGRNPPVLGTNNLEVTIRDAGGGVVADAKVLVNYYMPPMPRMAPMNYLVEAPFSWGKYRAAMNLIMEGPWVVAIKIGRQGKMVTAKFNIYVP